MYRQKEHDCNCKFFNKNVISYEKVTACNAEFRGLFMMTEKFMFLTNL